MKKIFMASILLIFISGCEMALRQPPNNIIFVTSPATAATTLTSNPLGVEPIPSATASIENISPVPIFRDEFDATLQPGWEWQNENNRNWSLLAVPGVLQIDVIGGYVHLKNASNVLLRPTPEGEFQIETTLLFNPWGSDQFAGLIMYGSDEDFIQAGIAYCAPIYGCVGRGLYMDVYQGGDLQIPRHPIEYGSRKVYMRLMRQGNTFSFLVSNDGSVWFRANSYTTDMVLTKIGIITGQNLYDETVPAIFEYFQVSKLD